MSICLSLSDIPHLYVIREGIGQLIMPAVLLDQHQEVLDTPSEGHTSPHR